jgi:hypothetical protein
VGFFDLTEDEKRSFNSVVRHTVLDGPLLLARLSDSQLRHRGMNGAFWMYASEVEEILHGVSNGAPYGLRFIREVSSRWAVCDDWGDLQRIWIMRIPAGSTLHAYFGFAKFQPKTFINMQQKLGKNTSNYYNGGSIQLVTRITDQERGWITGPFRSLDFSLSKLKDV